jgi:hypothetical protein
MDGLYQCYRWGDEVLIPLTSMPKSGRVYWRTSQMLPLQSVEI